MFHVSVFLEALLHHEKLDLVHDLFSHYTFFFLSFFLTFTSVVLFFTASPILVLFDSFVLLVPFILIFFSYPLLFFFCYDPFIPYHRTTTKNHLTLLPSLFSFRPPSFRKKRLTETPFLYFHHLG